MTENLSSFDDQHLSFIRPERPTTNSSKSLIYLFHDRRPTAKLFSFILDLFNSFDERFLLFEEIFSFQRPTFSLIRRFILDLFNSLFDEIFSFNYSTKIIDERFSLFDERFLFNYSTTKDFHYSTTDDQFHSTYSMTDDQFHSTNVLASRQEIYSFDLINLSTDIHFLAVIYH